MQASSECMNICASGYLECEDQWKDGEPGSGCHVEATPQRRIVHDWVDSFSHVVTQEHEAAFITVTC